jgi:hypothetical protein
MDSRENSRRKTEVTERKEIKKERRTQGRGREGRKDKNKPETF